MKQRSPVTGIPLQFHSCDLRFLSCMPGWYATQLSGSFQYCVRQSAAVESQMTSCERVM
jgi:hypothetical protein